MSFVDNLVISFFVYVDQGLVTVFYANSANWKKVSVETLGGKGIV